MNNNNNNSSGSTVHDRPKGFTADAPVILPTCEIDGAGFSPSGFFPTFPTLLLKELTAMNCSTHCVRSVGGTGQGLWVGY